MTEVDFSGDFLNTENCKDGDIAEIIGEGEYRQMEYKGVKKLVFNIPVRVNGKDKIYSPNQNAGREFSRLWGKETKNWIGKKFQILLFNDMNKIRLIPKPLTETKV